MKSFASTRRSVLRGIIAAVGLLVLASACGDSPEAGDHGEPLGNAQQGLTTVTSKWSVASSANAPFLDLAPRADGSALASTRQNVVSISPSGVRSTVFTGSASEGAPRLHRGVEGFVVRNDKGANVYDAAGTRKGALAFGANEYVRLVPGSLSTFVPRAVSADPENSAVDQGRVFTMTGAQSASFATPGLVQSRATKTHIFWATRTGMKKTSLTGATVWSSSSIAAHQFETDDAGRYLVVNRSGDTRVLELYDQTTRIGASTFESPLWNIAISPTGQYAAGNSKAVARLFNGGKLVASVQLGGALPVSLDVSNAGSMILGTQDRAKKVTAVSVYGPNGALGWTKSFPDDANGYRPDVRFSPDGKGFFVRDQSGLSFYTLEVL